MVGQGESERWSSLVRVLGGSREDAFVHFCKGIMLDVLGQTVREEMQP